VVQLDARVERFVESLGQQAPGDGVTGPLLGCWHALRGEWDAAHDAVQGDSTSDAWVHAALHREEGDDANAAYWYSRAGREPAPGAFRQEYLAIASHLLA
jgi:hypothetical protein